MKTESRIQTNSRVEVLVIPETIPRPVEQLFSPEVVEIIRPFWETHYEILDIGPSPNPPIYYSGISYEKWISDWTRLLISKSTGNLNI
jgi:hypothetical protein